MLKPLKIIGSLMIAFGAAIFLGVPVNLPFWGAFLSASFLLLLVGQLQDKEQLVEAPENSWRRNTLVEDSGFYW